MLSNLLGSYIFLNILFTVRSGRLYEEHYAVSNDEELSDLLHQIKHHRIKKSLPDVNITTTANTSTELNATTPALSANVSTTSRQYLITTKSRQNNESSNLNSSSSTMYNPSTMTTLLQHHTTPISNITTNETNIGTIKQDNHLYFQSHYFESGQSWWFDLNDGAGTPKLHYGLTKNLQYSDTIKTTFPFPYYGHDVNEVTITNKGFIFLGEKLHKFNASIQYVAPLMADFGAYLHNETSIHYVDTGDRFTVEWRNMKLRNQTAKPFTFQCSVLQNGTIVFAYKNIPLAISEIKNSTFPVRVGLSDGFIIRYIRYGLFWIQGRIYTRIRYHVYYRYHQIKLPREQVHDGSAFVFTPLPNCILYKSCDSCVNSKTQFSCGWCSALKRCSDGFDRKRHSWLVAKCYVDKKTTCPIVTSEEPHTPVTTPRMREHSDGPSPRTPSPSGEEGVKGKNKKTKSNDGGVSSSKRAGIAVLIIFCVAIVIVVAGWIAYAYTHPLTKSGMFLMQYGNPTKWRRRRSGKTDAGSSFNADGNITFKSLNDDSTA